VPPAQTNADLAVAGELRLAVMRLARRLRRERSSSDDLSLTQLSTLSTLELHGEMTLKELAAHERVQPPSMTKTVAFLEDKGLATRTADPTDGRQVLIALTAAARALLKEDRKRRDAWLAQRLRDLTPDEVDVLRAAAPILERLRQQ
jgi:DNA-binding MarR family transcriptional regulator